MSSTAATGPLSQTSVSAEEVVGYLSKNPTFFHVFPNLLEDLSVPHPKTGQAVSLLERKIHQLRIQKEALQVEVDTMVDIAGENGQLFHKVQGFTKDLMAAQTDQQAVDCVFAQMQDLFSVDQVAMVSWDIPATSVQGLTQLGVSQAWADVMKSSLHLGESKCGLVENDWQKGLFHCEECMQSVCLLPLGEESTGKIWGVLALGSRADRFRPDLGTYFLNMMAELISAKLNHLFN